MKPTDVEFLQRIKREVIDDDSIVFFDQEEMLRLLSLAEAGRQRWVPVSERLPELGIDVDVADEFSTDVDVLTRVDQGNVFWECGHQNGWDYWKPRPAPPSAPVLPKPFKHPQCPRCRSLPPLRMLQQVPLIWICDCCTQAFNGELKLWSIADAVLPEGTEPSEREIVGWYTAEDEGRKSVLPEGQPQCKWCGLAIIKHYGFEMWCEEIREGHKFEPISDTSGEGQTFYVECDGCGVEATAVPDSICSACGKERMVPRDIDPQ